ncbi:MAG: methyltransferase domain-containing protein [Pseudobdellovibrionaceae bacterium]|nr:methyltransferase domain-containing protein [Bdellovibrionales bacterium]USN47566.1 MAG: methyltransferase domain-containing protein [Pseudobdellovibrionaceae bacterium]
MSQLDKVRDYYGKVLKTKNDLKTTACCSVESMPAHLIALTKNIDAEIQDKFYGCGAPFPSELKGLTVLDLGCGTGRDVYLLSQLVGETGKVIGIDMTDEQLEVANRHVDSQMKKFGYTQSNVQFVKGYIEDLESAGIANESVDLVVSNCVINLSPEKERVFREIFRVLKPGGELYFSDVYCDRRLPQACREDQTLLGECLGGALYTEDFRRLLFEVGCKDSRQMYASEISITDSEISKKVNGARFYSITMRAFKLPLEDRCEDYGQVAYYKGTLDNNSTYFALDDHHLFEKGKPMLVCSNTAMMLADTRFKNHFRIEGDLSTHYGLFDCGPSPVAGNSAAEVCAPGGGCC